MRFYPNFTNLGLLPTKILQPVGAVRVNRFSFHHQGPSFHLHHVSPSLSLTFEINSKADEKPTPLVATAIQYSLYIDYCWRATDKAADMNTIIYRINQVQWAVCEW